MAGQRRLKYALFAASALLSAGYGVMFTVLAEYRNRYGISEAKIGWIVAAGFFTSFAAQIGLAPLADRGHSKRLVVVGIVIDIIGLLGMASSHSFALLILSRVLMGIGMGIAIPAMRRILVVVDPGEIGANMGKMLAMDVTGFAVGPVISALTVGAFGLAAPFLIIAAVNAAMLLPLSRLPVAEGSAEEAGERFAIDLLRHRGVLAALLIGLGVFVMIGTFDALWSIVMDDLDAPTWIAKAGITVFALPLVIFGPLAGRVTDRYNAFLSSGFGLAAGALFMACYGWLARPIAMLGVGVIHGVNDGLTITGTGVAVGTVVPPERQGAAQGLLGGCQTLTAGVTAIIAGWLYKATSRAFTYSAAAVTMIAFAAGGVTVASRAGYLAGRRPLPAGSETVPAA